MLFFLLASLPLRHPINPAFSSVGDFVGNQHGGKYDFGSKPDAQCQAGADYSSQKRIEMNREADVEFVETEASDYVNFENDVGTVVVDNADPTWVYFRAKIEGPDADAYSVHPSEGSMPPRRLVELSVRRISTALSPDSSTTLLVATEEGDSYSWRLS